MAVVTIVFIYVVLKSYCKLLTFEFPISVLRFPGWLLPVYNLDTIMPLEQLNDDILYGIVEELASIDNKDYRSSLFNLSLTSRTLRYATRPILFAKVKWPHQNQHDEKSDLFPSDILLPYIK